MIKLIFIILVPSYFQILISSQMTSWYMPRCLLILSEHLKFGLLNICSSFVRRLGKAWVCILLLVSPGEHHLERTRTKNVGRITKTNEIGHHHHHWQNSPFWAFLRGFCQICLSDHPIFISLDFATTIFLQSKVVSFVSNAQPGGPARCIYVPLWQGGPVISQALSSLFITFYDSQGYAGVITTRLHTRKWNTYRVLFILAFERMPSSGLMQHKRHPIPTVSV
jgi:hypothetical protein